MICKQNDNINKEIAMIKRETNRNCEAEKHND